MKRILVIDDSLRRDSYLGQYIIGAIGAAVGVDREISVDFIATAEEAIILLKDKKYDLVLMDGKFDRSELQGPEAVTKIRRFSNVPVLMISNSPEMNKIGVAKGADDFLDNKVEIITDKGMEKIKLLIDKSKKIKKSTQLCLR